MLFVCWCKCWNVSHICWCSISRIQPALNSLGLTNQEERGSEAKTVWESKFKLSPPCALWGSDSSHFLQQRLAKSNLKSIILSLCLCVNELTVMKPMTPSDLWCRGCRWVCLSEWRCTLPGMRPAPPSPVSRWGNAPAGRHTASVCRPYWCSPPLGSRVRGQSQYGLFCLKHINLSVCVWVCIASAFACVFM